MKSSQAILCQHVRKFINGSYGILNEILDNDNSSYDVDELSIVLLEKSRLLRKEILDLSENISALAEAVDTSADDIELSTAYNCWEKEYDYVFHIEKTWHICEIFLLNPAPNLSMDMLKWLKETTVVHSFGAIYEAFYSMSEPELRDGSDASLADFTGSALNYWQSILLMLMNGEMSLAVSTLKLHSEIAAVFDARVRRPSSIQQQGISALHCQELFEAIESHPYIQHHAGASSSLGDWQARLRTLRNSGSTVLARIPELDSVLRVLLGEADLLIELSYGDWMRLALAELHYKYPSPLTRSDLARIIEDCMRTISQQQPQQQQQHHEVVSIYLLKEAMQGRAGPILRDISKRGAAEFVGTAVAVAAAGTGAMEGSSGGDLEVMGIMDSVSDALAIVSQLCSVHLTTILARSSQYGGGAVALAHTVLPNARYNTSFLEELYLDVAQSLNAFESSMELVLGYLHPAACPLQGKQFARKLLNARVELFCNVSDADVLFIADALERWGWEEDTRRVLVNRAMLWLSRANTGSYPQYTLAAASVASTFSNNSSSSSTLAKVVNFLQMGEDWSKLSILLDHLLHRCVMGVTRCAALFTGLRFLSSPALQPLTELLGTSSTSAAPGGGGGGGKCNRGRYDLAEYCRVGVLQQSTQDGIDFLQNILVEVQEVLQTIVGSRFLGIDSMDEKFDARAVDIRQYATAGERDVGMVVNVLFTYVKAIRLLLAFKAEQATQAQQQQTQAQSSASSSSSSMYRGVTVAARLLASLLVDESGSCVANIRYWMHLLELSAWSCRAISDAESALNNATDSASMLNARHDDRWTTASTQVFGSEVVYGMLGSLQDVLGSYCVDRLFVCLPLSLATDGFIPSTTVEASVPGSATVSPPPVIICDSDEQAECIRTLRLSLLGLLTGSIVQQNADMGYTKQVLHDKEYASTSLASKIIASSVRQRPNAVLSNAFAASLPMMKSGSSRSSGGASNSNGYSSGSSSHSRGPGANRSGMLGSTLRQQQLYNNKNHGAAYEFLTGSSAFF